MKMKTGVLIMGIIAVLTLVGFVTAYQFFESNNNETYCNSVSSKFCKSNPFETTLLQNPEDTDIPRTTELSKLLEKGEIDGFSFSSDGFSISSDGAMIKDMYFENPDAPELTISLEFFKGGVITMTDPIKIIRSEFPERSFSSLLITVNGNPVEYDKLSRDRIALKLDDFSEIIVIRGLP